MMHSLVLCVLMTFFVLTSAVDAFGAASVEKMQKRSNSRLCNTYVSSQPQHIREMALTVLKERGVGGEYCDPRTLLLGEFEDRQNRARAGIRGSSTISGDTCDSLYALRSDGRTLFAVSKVAYDAGVRRGDTVIEQDNVAFPDITNRRPPVKAGAVTRLVLGRGDEKIDASIVCPDARANPQEIHAYSMMSTASTDFERAPERAQLCAGYILQGYVGGKVELGSFFMCEAAALWHAAEDVEEFWINVQPLIRQVAYESIDYHAGDREGLKSVEGSVALWKRAMSYGADTEAVSAFEQFWLQHRAAAEEEGTAVLPKLPVRAVATGKDCTFAENNWAAIFLGYGVATDSGGQCTSAFEGFDSRLSWYQNEGAQ